MQKQRILIVHNYYQIPGGEDTVVENEKELLEENGHPVFLYTRNNSEIKKMAAIRKLCLPFMAVFNWNTYYDVKKIILKEHIDIVHVHNTLSLISPAVYYAALSCHVPVIQTIHNFRLLCPNAMFYRDGHICEDCLRHGQKCAVRYGCYRNSRIQTSVCVLNMKVHHMTGIYKKINYICLTEFNKEKLLHLKGIKPQNIFIKPNFTYSQNEIIPPESRPNQFVYAGRLDKQKGMDILLEAWKHMGPAAPKLIICGSGPMESWCQQYITQNQLCMVEMRGFIENTEVRKLIAVSKALILPTQWYEGFPMNIVEALSAGTPVIASDIGNTGALITEGITGCKFRCDSPSGLADAVKRISKYPDIYAISKAEFDEKYSAEANYQYYEKILQTVS